MDGTLFYGLLAGVIVGFHVFSVKYIQIRFAYNAYTLGLILISLMLWGLSRIFLFISYKYSEVSLFSHLLLLVGVFVTILLDYAILKEPIRTNYIYTGIFFIFLGFILIFKHKY